MWTSILQTSAIAACSSGPLFACLLAPIALEPSLGPPRLIVDRGAELGSAADLSDFLAVQGAPLNRSDPFEVQAWRQLGLRTDLVQLLNDEFYWPEGGLHVVRSAGTPPACASGARGPLGPYRDLWLCAEAFEAFRRDWAETIGQELPPILNLGVMPRALSYNPRSPKWMMMSPARAEEWTAVVREAGAYLAEIGWTEPLVFFFSEYENLFYGKDRPLYDGTMETARARAEDYAELYILTQRALQEHLPRVKLVGGITSVYSRELTRELQANPYALGTEDWLEAVRRLDPTFVPSAVGWQGYYWYGLDGYGPNRLLEGAEKIIEVLRNLGLDEDIPQYLEGWNGLFGNPEPVSSAIPADAWVLKEAGHMAAEIIDMLDLGRNRRIHGAYYYTWNLEAPLREDYRCGFPYQSLVSTVHDGYPSGDPDLSDCDVPPSQIECLRATYHALYFLRELRDGVLVATEFAGRGPVDLSPLRAVAAKSGEAIRAVVADRNGATLPFLRLEVRRLQPRRDYTVTVKTIEPLAHACATVRSVEVTAQANAGGLLTLALPRLQGNVLQVLVQPR